MGDNRQMYFWMMLSDMIMTITLELLAQSGTKPDMTKEEWFDISKTNIERRKAAINVIKSQA